MPAMDWIEIVHLRSYSQVVADEALASFHQLTLSECDDELVEIALYRDMVLRNDLCVIIHRHGDIFGAGKSPLGVRLASAFSEFGLINHYVLTEEGRLTCKQRKCNRERQESDLQ